MEESNVAQNSPQAQQPVQSSNLPHKSKNFVFILITLVILIILGGATYLVMPKSVNKLKQLSIIPTITITPSMSASQIGTKICVSGNSSIAYQCEGGIYRIPPSAPGMGDSYMDSRGNNIVICGGSVINKKDDSKCKDLINLKCQTNNFCTTSVDEIANWKTYVNNKYLYSIRYPTDWSVLGPRLIDPPGSGNVRIAYIFGEASQLPIPGQAFMDIVVEPNPENNIPTKDWYLEWVKKAMSWVDSNAYQITEIIFKGMKAVKVAKNDTNEEILFIQNNYLFRINYFYFKDNNRQPPDEVFKLMLSTFKFTDQNQQALTSLEINGFPVFPGATFAKKETTTPCTGKESGFTDCGSTTYTWTSDKGDKVYDWYTKDQANSGWKMSGGAGSFIDSQNYNGNIALKKSNLTYGLEWEARDNKVTFTLVIPNKVQP